MGDEQIIEEVIEEAVEEDGGKLPGSAVAAE